MSDLIGSYLCKPNDGYELDRREAQAEYNRLTERNKALEAAIQAARRLDYEVNRKYLLTSGS